MQALPVDEGILARRAQIAAAMRNFLPGDIAIFKPPVGCCLPRQAAQLAGR
jgi:hypothetical protein